jgi:hypothetical protein
MLPRPSVRAALFDHLEQDVQDARMGFLYFVKQNDNVGLLADFLGQLASRFAVHVAAR